MYPRGYRGFVAEHCCRTPGIAPHAFVHEQCTPLTWSLLLFVHATHVRSPSSLLKRRASPDSDEEGDDGETAKTQSKRARVDGEAGDGAVVQPVVPATSAAELVAKQVLRSGLGRGCFGLDGLSGTCPPCVHCYRTWTSHKHQWGPCTRFAFSRISIRR